jgi:ubiquinone/menaquinone biosynthesis C-methylase UbiE
MPLKKSSCFDLNLPYSRAVEMYMRSGMPMLDFASGAEMLARSRQTARALGLGHVQFRDGLAEALPVADAWADVVISNGVINLCADKQAVFAEIFRVLRPGGRLQFADIANGRPVPAEALRDIDLWTG